MPRIKLDEKVSKFKKTAYRPWNLLDEDYQNPTTNKDIDSLTENPVLITNHENLGQTEDKSKTNPGQTEDKPRTNLGQTEDKSRTNLRHNLGHNIGQIEDKPRTNLGQIEGKLETKSNYLSLCGLQKKITLFIFDQCKLKQDASTDPLAINQLAEFCDSSVMSVRKTLQRLESKGIIARLEYKAGRGGWTRYHLNSFIYQEIILNETNDKLRINLGQTKDKLRTNIGQTEDKLETQFRTQLRTSLPSSSSFSIIEKNTTTGIDNTNESTGELDSRWDLDISSLGPFGFTQNHLQQIAKTGLLEPHLVQECIYAFANDLNEGLVQCESSPLNFFMGIVKKGRLYTSKMKNYETPREQLMRSFLEREERLKVQREEIEKKLREKSFGQWLATMTAKEQMTLAEKAHEELQSITGEKDRFNPARAISTLISYFERFLWLEKRQACYEENGLLDIFSETA